MNKETKVSDYMTEDLKVVGSEDRIGKIKQLIKSTGYDGFPVCDGEKLVGHISARSVILAESDDAKVRTEMNRDYPTIRGSYPVIRAGRIIFRQGISEILVVNEDKELTGMLTNTDILRSQIERSTPSKVESLVDMLSKVHEDVEFTNYTDEVKIERLSPTQKQVFKDELEGRVHELENGLAEPIIVIKNGNSMVVADGHHRMVASDRIGKNSISSYVLEPSREIELGMHEQAKDRDLQSVEDIVVETERGHPHVDSIEPISDLRRD